ncbi:hypothetical protein QYM36_017738 [Artemia franciscana]|uniref:Reverse transcriptase domain-containing protein n=1 Tax=Artemia franciscana TaxID=6661 RepID=A0AA88KUN4_ARTSF|nr:hypothetical protein QYM36_017738 [Artemia franciscana]
MEFGTYLSRFYVTRANILPLADLTNEVSGTEDGREFVIESISTEEKVEKLYALIKLTENDSELAFKINKGAKTNILPLKDFNKLARKPALLPTADVLTSYTGEQLKILGTANLKSTHPQPPVQRTTSADQVCHQCQQSSPIQKLLNEFRDVFGGIGTLPGTYKIYLKEGATPTIQPPKQVPFALKAKFKEELHRLESLGVIENVTKPTQWVNSLVLVRKANKSLRICLDPVDLNRAIERPHQPIPLFDEVAAKCKGAKKFFKMDARKGYWSMVLDKPSSELTTFNTMYGRYKWNRYPFGVISAQGEYQRKMEEVFTELDIGLIVDDIVGIGCSDAEHDANLRAVLQATRDKGVWFNKEKCVFDTTSII